MMHAAISLAIVSAQMFGSFSGTVVDPLGAVLPNAPVALVQPSRGERHEIRTDRAGQFEFQGLAPGDYQLEAQTPGFEPYRSAVAISGGQTLRRVINLQIGRLHETVRTVEGEAPSSAANPALSYSEPPCPAPPTTTVGGNLRPPRKLRDVKPDYPASMRGSGRDVVVVLDAKIGLDGFMKEFQPHEPVDQPFYDALLLAAREWRFSATLLNCVPQEVNITVTGRFLPAR